MQNTPILRYREIKKFAKIVWKTVIRSVFFSQKKLLTLVESFIINSIGDSNRLNCITPSGRAALNCVFSLHETDTIILPEYICNVVPMSAGDKKIEYYHIDSDYQLNLQNVLSIVADKPDCCVLFPSYLNREINIADTVLKIRKINSTCTIVFDECQNISSIKCLPELDTRSYVIYSFNNKMTYGFLGGAIIQGRGNNSTIRRFSPASFTDNIHGFIVALKSGIKEIIEAYAHHFHAPTDPDISFGNGIYGVEYKHILKVSIAAASLIEENWEWSLSCLKHNARILNQLEKEGKVTTIHGRNESYMPYVPIKEKKDIIQGKVPLKGRYGILASDKIERNICFYLHNAMKLEIES